MAGLRGRRLLARRPTRALRSVLDATVPGADTRTALTTIGHAAADAFGAIDGLVMIRKDDDLRVYSSSAERVEPIANVIGRGAFNEARELPSVHVIRTGRPLAINDVTSYDGPPEFFEACRRAGVRAVLCVPIRRASQTAGVLNLGFARPKRLRRRHIAMATAFADATASFLDDTQAGALGTDTAPNAAPVESLDLKFLVAKAVDSVRTAIGTRNIVVQVPEGWNVWAATYAIDRVLVTLLTNAAQFSPVRSTITVTAMQEKHHAIVSVHDEGIGIDPKDQEQIFDSGYAARSGIDFATARASVEAMGGEIWLTSARGAGSTFWFTLKLDEAA